MKTVLITGVGKGIGKALSDKFLAEGWLVLGAYHETAPLPHENLLSFPLDLSSPQSISTCAQAIRETGKTVSILINNAGILVDEDDTAVVVEKLRETLEVNLIGTIDFIEQVISVVEDGGHIVNISSTAGSLNLAINSVSHFPNHYPAYKISKTAINMYTRTLATRLKERGIVVSSVHPGWVKTDMGGPEAEISPEEAAQHIYELAITRPETGGFWFKGEKLAW